MIPYIIAYLNFEPELKEFAKRDDWRHIEAATIFGLVGGL
jgi:hypothetical protein